MLTKKNKKAFNYFNVLAIFSAFFLFGFLAIPTCSPIIGTNAISPDSPVYDTDVNPDHKISFNIKTLPLLAMSVDTNDLNITGSFGSFVNGDINITVDTNNAWGYTLQVEDKDSNTALTSNESELQFTSNFEGTKTAEQMADNTWGYSLADTEYELFNSIPALNNPVTIRTTDSNSFDSTSVTTFKVGINVGNDIDPGVYADVIMFTTFVNPADICIGEGFYCITTMQEMTNAICKETTTPTVSATEFTYIYSEDTSKVPRTILRDTRDDKTYVVSKLADGNCWMSQNLDLELSTETALNDGNTDLNSKESWTPTNSTDTELVKWADSYYDLAYKDYYYYDGFTVPRIPERSYKPGAEKAYLQNGKTVASTPSSSDPYQAWEKVGTYYNYFAATAGSGPDTIYTMVKNEERSGRARDSICPKGWRLPDGWTMTPGTYAIPTYDTYDLLNIYNANDNVITAANSPINMVYAGYVNSHYEDTRYEEQSVERNPISLDGIGVAGLYGENSIINGNTPSVSFAYVRDGMTNYTGGNYSRWDFYGGDRIIVNTYYSGSYDDLYYNIFGSYDDSFYGPTAFHGFSVRCMAR